jgi:two-component system OmpR family response regulator
MKKHILVVDDEASIRNLLTEFLTRSGYRVTAANSPAEAQQAVKQDPPQLVISDLQLADSDGLDMIDQLKASLPDTPMMLLTGVLFDPKVIRDVLSKKVSAYLQKTAPLAQVLGEVQRLIGPP